MYLVELTLGAAIVLKRNLHFNKMVTKEGKDTVESYTLARFFDLKYEYLQHLPPPFSPRLMSKSPFLNGKGRHLVGKIRDVYTSRTLDEPFVNSVEQRRSVKFDVLIRYNTEK